MDHVKFLKSGKLIGVLLLSLSVSVSVAQAQTFLGPLDDVSEVASRLPSNGDVNPYGIVRVPVTMGKLVAGNLLVSNFNNNLNQQGTGTTIVQITPGGTRTQFAKINAATLPGACPGGVLVDRSIYWFQSPPKWVSLTGGIGSDVLKYSLRTLDFGRLHVGQLPVATLL